MIAAPFSVIVVNFGRPELVRRLIATLAVHPDATLVRELTVVDNGFPDRGDSRQTIDASSAPFPVQFVQNGSSSYASGVNRGATVSRGPLLLVCNNDLEWLPGESLAPLVEAFDGDPSVGVAGPRQLYPDGRWQRTYGWLPSRREALGLFVAWEQVAHAWRVRRRDRRSVRSDFVDGACLATRRACFEQLGGFDERHDFYGEDVDYCWRAVRAGWEIRYAPGAAIKHVRGASSNAVARREYTRRLARAKQAVVASREGPRAAAVYARLVRLAALQRVLLLTIPAILKPGAFAERRALALEWARAQLPDRAS